MPDVVMQKKACFVHSPSMATYNTMTIFAILVIIFGFLAAIPTDAIGVDYGTDGNNLPPPSDVVGIYKSRNINNMRLYYPNLDALQALRGSNIGLMLGLPNDQLQSIAGDPSAAANWVRTNVQAYSANVNFRYIAVGNEVIPGNLAQFVLPAMRNIKNALTSAGLNNIKVSTSVSTSVASGFPPSAGVFTPGAQPFMGPIINFLASSNAPLLVNVYPYFSYVGNKAQIDINYALFKSPNTVVSDPPYNYQNLFDALVDTTYAAMDKAGGANVPIVVSESGWPSAGGDSASVQNAQTYNQNLINHVGKGTPRRPGALETYIFAMFNENLKQPPGIENNFGLFYPNKQPVYQINFN